MYILFEAIKISEEKAEQLKLQGKEMQLSDCYKEKLLLNIDLIESADPIRHNEVEENTTCVTMKSGDCFTLAIRFVDFLALIPHHSAALTIQRRNN